MADILILENDSKGMQGDIQPVITSIDIAPFKVILKQEIILPEYMDSEG